MADPTPPNIDRDPSPAPGGGDDDDDAAFLARVDRYLDGVGRPDAADVAALERELAADPAKRRAFALICLGEQFAHEEFATAERSTDGALAPDEEDADAVPSGRGGAARTASLGDAMVLPALHEADAGGEDEEDLRPAPASPARPARRTPWHARHRAALAAAAVVALAAGTALLFRGGGPNPPPAAAPPPAYAATVVDALGVTWDLPQTPLSGTRLRAGRPVELSAGLLTITMDDGTNVVLEAPCRFDPSSASSLALAEGRAAAKLPAGASGFVVSTPAGTVTDLGTEFGVAYLSGAAEAEVHVFEGKVRVAPPAGGPASASPIEVSAGDAARTGAAGVTVTPGGSSPQRFVRDVTRGPQATTRLSVADLLSGGDGRTRRVGGVIDPATGASGQVGAFEPGVPATSDGRYHRVAALPVVDGCFVPPAVAGGGGPAATRVDSAGHAFAFPGAVGATTTRVVVGGKLPTLPNNTFVVPTLGGVDYSEPGRNFVFFHPDVGLTFDLAAIRRLHPAARLTRLRAVAGLSVPSRRANSASLVVLVDGAERFARRGFTHADGPFDVDVPLEDGARFLTVVSTGDGSPAADQVLIADPYIDVAPRGAF